MTEQASRDGAAVRFPPPLLPVITIIAGYVLGRFVPLLSADVLPTPARYWIGATIAIVAVAVLVVWPFRQFQATKQDVKPWTSTPEIVVDGPYRFTRNPMYLAMVIVCLAFAIILSELWVLVLTPVCAYLLWHVAIRHEEAYLETKFGQPYLDYKARVRRWL